MALVMLSMPITISGAHPNRENIVATHRLQNARADIWGNSFLLRPRFLSPAFIINSEHALNTVASNYKNRIKSKLILLNGSYQGTHTVWMVTVGL